MEALLNPNLKLSWDPDCEFSNGRYSHYPRGHPRGPYTKFRNVEDLILTNYIPDVLEFRITVSGSIPRKISIMINHLMIIKDQVKVIIEATKDANIKIAIRCHKDTKFYQFLMQHDLIIKHFPQSYKELLCLRVGS